MSQPDRKSTRLNSSHANIYPLSLHDALPISREVRMPVPECSAAQRKAAKRLGVALEPGDDFDVAARSEEHTSELQSRQYLPSFPTRRSSDLEGGSHAGP